MLEILILVFVCKGIGSILRKKGRKPLGLQILTVFLWFGGEFVAGFIYGWMRAMEGRPFNGEIDMSLYLCALVGAGVGTAISFTIAALIPPAVPDVAPQFSSQNPMGYTGEPTSSNPYNPYSDPSQNPFRDLNQNS